MHTNDWADPVIDPIVARVQERLAARSSQLELRQESDGWVWEPIGHKIHTRRVFESARLALEHADQYTRFWFPLHEELPGELVRGA